MQRASIRHKTQDPRLKTQDSRFSRLMSYVLRLASCVLCLPLLCGCSRVSPPADYYQQVLEMEEYGERERRDTGRHPDEIVAPVRDSEPIKIEESPVDQLASDMSQEQTEEKAVEKQEGIQAEPEKPPRREIVQESSPASPLPSEPIAISSDVIKIALRDAALEVNARTVESVNGRLSGGKNYVRVSFLSESVDDIGDKFATICAVIYYLNGEANMVDVVAGIAEDKQASLLAVLQSDMSDIVAWMTDEISRAEWYSRATKKAL
jgi:hypothetical protein